jgi:hypothetical protein
MTINEKKQLSNYIKGLVRESLGEMDSMPNWWNDKYRSKMDSDEEDMIDLDDESFDEADEHDDEEFEPAFSLSEEIKGSDLGGVFSTDDPKAAKAVRDDTDDYDDWYGESWSSKKGREDLSNLIDKRSRGEDAELELGNYPDSAVRDRQMEKDVLDNEKADSDRYDKPFGDLDDTENLWSGDPDLESDDDEIAGLDELRQLAESYARQSVARILSESKKKKGKRKNKKEKTSSKDKTVVSQLNADGTNAAHYYYKLYGVENGTEAQKASARSKGYKKAKGKKNDTGVPYKFTSKERNRLSSLLTDRK